MNELRRGAAESYPAPAKLNLFLHVTGRRADGYHLLQTVFRFIDYGDRLSFAVRDDDQIKLTRALPGLAPEQDLCFRAAQALQKMSGCRLGADITLEKKIPLGGGLGGGSSDAATTLIVLNRLWSLQVSRDDLMALGLKLGADVPVFVFGQNAWAEGVGEALSPISLPPAWYVVLVPPVSVATAEVFAAPELTRNTLPVTIPAFSAKQNRNQTHNDLEKVVRARYPQVAQHLDWLSAFGTARMTGSGACVFAAFESKAAADAVMEKLPSGMQGFVARGLDEHPLKDFCA